MKRILVFRVGSLGDGLIVMPTLCELRRHETDIHIDLLTNNPVVSQGKAVGMGGVLKDFGVIDGVVNYSLNRKIKDILNLVLNIKKGCYDELLYLMPVRSKIQIIRDYIFFSVICGLEFKKKIKYLIDHQSLGAGEHEASRLMRLAGLAVDKKGLRDLVDAQKSICVDKNKVLDVPYIVFSLGAKDWVKDWGVENWEILVGKLSQKYQNVGLVAIGVESEGLSSDRVLSRWHGPILNLCGKTSVIESCKLISSSILYVGHDSGPMHLAAIAKVPIVAIFASADISGKWAPLSDKSVIHRSEISCAGCRMTNTCPYDKKCITSITVDEVLLSIENKLPVNFGI